DGGAGSLRQAILNANASQGADTIRFQIPGSGVRTIITSGLPIITESDVIDGTTQTGFSGTPLIELTGLEAPAGANGLQLNSIEGSTVRGLIINRFSGSGIIALTGPNHIERNWIGLASNGTAA